MNKLRGDTSATLIDGVSDCTRARHFKDTRIALYSPGMVGTGNMRRNLFIAQILASSALQPTILMIAETRDANVLHIPRGGDCLTLPALRKESNGQISPRHLAIPLLAVTGLRAKTIAAALEAFEPDVFIVDHLPRGACGELDSALENLHALGRARCVLVLQDVLQDAEVARCEWGYEANEQVIRDFYDAIWIYGDPAVYEPVREYGFAAEVAAKVYFTGYLDSRSRPDECLIQLLRDLLQPRPQSEWSGSLTEEPEHYWGLNVETGCNARDNAEHYGKVAEY
jgi:predicted glycosyltransferase